MFGLLAFIPGIGPIVSAITGLIGIILRCIPCLVMIAVGAAFLFGDVHGRGKEKAICQANDKAMELKAAQRDISIARDIADQATLEAAKLASQKDTLEKKVNAYEQELAKRGTAVCKLDPADIDRLRNIGMGKQK